MLATGLTLPGRGWAFDLLGAVSEFDGRLWRGRGRWDAHCIVHSTCARDASTNGDVHRYECATQQHTHVFPDSHR
jgi:hypothetical protein